MPTWSPDGERVAFVRLEPRPIGTPLSKALSGGYSLYVANADGTWPHRLIDSVNEESELPSWSPDGTRVAIDMGGAIGVANVLTGEASIVPHIRWANHPAWSPASDEIAYVNENGEVWVATARGTNKRRISTRSGEDTFNLSWSPDGREVAFVGRKRDGTLGVIVAGADGSGDRELCAWRDWGAWPVWSPTGKAIVFGRDIDPYRDPMLFVASADGSGAWPVGSGIYPSWAPDGRSVVAQRRSKRGVELARILLDTAFQPALPTGFGLSLYPDFSPDGRRVAFVGVGRCVDWTTRRMRRGVYSIGIGEAIPRPISGTLRELLARDCAPAES
jgi:TolB protein